jgi:O-antigen/teichoic acid export membrane protein
MSILRHSMYNLFGAAVPVAVSLLTVPIYLRVIGLDRYGILSLCWLVVGYLNFFDLGLGRATAQRVAALHDAGEEERIRSFWAGMSLSAALALVSVAVAWPVAQFALGSIKAAPELRSEIAAALPMLIAAIPVAILQGSLKGALEGRREFLLINTIVSAGALATGLLPLGAALVMGPDLAILVAASMAVRIVVLIAYAIGCAKLVPIRRFVLPAVQDLRGMLHFGAWLTVTNLASMIVFVDRFLVGAILGAAAVAIYVIPFNLMNQLLLLPAALSNALFPRLAASADGRALTRQAVFETSLILTPVALCGMIVVGPFLRLWIGADAAADGAPIAYVLALGVWANGLAQLPYAGLQAAGRTDVTGKLHLVEVLPYLALLWLALSTVGILGAALAWSARVIVDFVALAILDRVGWRVMRRVLVQAVALTALALTMLFATPNSMVQWVLASAICVATAVYSFAILPRSMVERAQAMLRSARL